MLRRLGIRGKILAALSVPVLVLFALAGVLSWQAIQEARATRAADGVVKTLAVARQLTSALQDERALSDRLFGPTASSVVTGQLENQRTTTDTAIKRLDASVAALDVAALDPAVIVAFDTLKSQLGILDSARSLVDSRQVALTTIDNGYASLLHGVATAPKNVAEGIDDRQLAKVLAANADVSLLIEGYRHESALGHEILAGDRDTGVESSLQAVMTQDDEMRLQLSASLYDFNIKNTITEVALPTDPKSFGAMRTSIATMTDAALAQWQPAAWDAAAYTEIGLITPAQVELDGVAVARAEQVAAAAQRQAVLTISAAAAAVVLSIIIALVIARSIVLPVRRLTGAAAAVRDRLPALVEQAAVPGQAPDLSIAEIPVRSRDEVGRLAAAFNDVNATTLQIAQEQAALRGSIAEMFVNVARRDQVLLNRQLTFIDALERSEEDPATLADLFRLDHLATRMRRNAESLLVLAGIDTGRKLRETLQLSDVIRTASSEIEHYERVQIDMPVDPRMLGHTALPAAHLLAELLENATMFSEPGSPVHVSTGRDENHVLITVVDQGLGMTPEERAQAQAKIDSTSAGDVLGAQRLGLFVVGRIAARLGAKVELSAGPHDQGTQADVRLPLALFVDVADVPLQAPAQPVLPPRAETPAAPEPEAVKEVDLAALTDGATDTGLPRRRAVRADADAGAPSQRSVSSTIPSAPSAEALTGAAASGADATWSPMVIERDAPLVRRRTSRGAHAADVPEPTGTELPQRRRAAEPVAPQAREAAQRPDGDARPAAPQDRVSMFHGFRSRRAEVVAASLHVDAHAEPSTEPEDVVDDVEVEEPFVVPSLEPDDEPMLVPGYESEADEQWLAEPAVPGVDEVGWADVPQTLDNPSWATPVGAVADQSSYAPADDLDETPWPPVAPGSFVPGDAAPVAPEPFVPVDAAPVAPEPFAPVAPESFVPVDAAPTAAVAPEPALGFAGGTTSWAAAPAAPDFETLVQGGPPAPRATEKAKRRGLFHRRPKSEPVTALPTVAALPPAAPVLPPAAPVLPPAAPVLPTAPVLPAATSFPAPPAPAPIAPPAPAPAVQAWAPEPSAPATWSPDTSDGSMDATQTFSDLAARVPARKDPEPPVEPEPVPGFTTPTTFTPAAGPQQTLWTPGTDGDEASPMGWHLPVPGESEWPGARAAHEPAVASPDPAVEEPEQARHAKPLVPSQHAYATFTPADDSHTVLAQRAGIAQQALAELSQLSTYRPQVGAPSAPLTRRTPTSIPEAPALSSRRPAGTSRDANQVRSLLASFQSGTSRGREAADSDSTSNEVTQRGL